MSRGWWVLDGRTTARYAIALLAILAAGLAGYWQMVEARQAGDQRLRTQRSINDIDRIELNLVDAETGQRGYLLTGKESYLQPYEEGSAAVTSSLERLRQAIGADDQQLARLEQTTALITEKLGELRRTIDLRRAGDLPGAVAIVQSDQGRQTMDRIRALLGEAREAASQHLHQRDVLRSGRFERAGRVVVAGSALALVVVAFATLALNGSARRQRRAERRVRESEERLLVTLRSIGDAVIATDPAGLVVFMNPVAEQLTGWTQRAAAGQPLEAVFTIVNEQTRAVVESPVAKVMREGIIVGLANHTVLLGRGGSETPIDDSGAPIRDAGGEIMGVVLVFRDVSDRKQAEEQNERLAQEENARHAAERASAAKDEFLAVLSHELRSPLQGILGWLGVLRAGGNDPVQQARALEAIERGVRQQAQLVGDLLDASRVVAGKLHIERLALDPATLVRECLDEIQPLISEKGVTLDIEVDECGTVMGDTRRLRQSVSNVLANAVKFTPAGGRITVHCRKEGERVVLTVSDTGEGIDPQFLPHLFDRFSQAVARRPHPTGGLGLGLSIARQIIDLHGGSISARSDGLGRGSSFEIVLPGAADAPAVARRERTGGDSLVGLSVLLVDDEADTREALKVLLGLRGAVVHDAASVSEALDVYARHRPRVVVSDISMPGQDGYELAAALRRAGDGPQIIALTGYAADSDRRQASESGFDAHVAKPVDVDELVAVIAGLRDVAARR
jgi:PAS domain S-box-containing protein